MLIEYADINNNVMIESLVSTPRMYAPSMYCKLITFVSTDLFIYLFIYLFIVQRVGRP